MRVPSAAGRSTVSSSNASGSCVSNTRTAWCASASAAFAPLMTRAPRTRPNVSAGVSVSGWQNGSPSVARISAGEVSIVAVRAVDGSPAAQRREEGGLERHAVRDLQDRLITDRLDRPEGGCRATAPSPAGAPRGRSPAEPRRGGSPAREPRRSSRSRRSGSSSRLVSRTPSCADAAARPTPRGAGS